MYEILIKAVSRANNSNKTIHFLTDLLSPTERIMLAKRLSIAYFLVKGGYTTREISEILKVSLTTVQKISLILNTQGNGYREIINSLTKEEQIEKFMGALTESLQIIPRPGSDWSQWRRNKELNKLKNKKVF